MTSSSSSLLLSPSYSFCRHYTFYQTTKDHLLANKYFMKYWSRTESRYNSSKRHHSQKRVQLHDQSVLGLSWSTGEEKDLQHLPRSKQRRTDRHTRKTEIARVRSSFLVWLCSRSFVKLTQLTTNQQRGQLSIKRQLFCHIATWRMAVIPL